MSVSTIQAATHSESLRAKIDLVYDELSATGAQVVGHPDARNMYPRFLIALFSLTRASVPLMEWALAECEKRAPQDDNAAKLRDYFRDHIPEEVGHDIWILEDLESMGIPRAEVLAQQPSATAAQLIGAQYYWTKFCHPVALLGYMELAEGYPPTTAMVADLKARTGYSDECLRALRRHATIDIEHREDLHRVMDSLVLTEEQKQLVALSALTSVDLIVQLFDEVLADASCGPLSHRSPLSLIT